MTADRCRWVMCHANRVAGWFCDEHRDRATGKGCLDAEPPEDQ